MPQVRLRVQTVSTLYGPLRAGQVVAVDEAHAGHWQRQGIADVLPAATASPEPTPSLPARPTARGKARKGRKVRR
ncbi:MAG: hypothetical protein NUW22_13810 [Acidobacteria bacterium]|nr:hypothetical protein [Acidobacteriota bacterium]